MADTADGPANVPRSPIRRRCSSTRAGAPASSRSSRPSRWRRSATCRSPIRRASRFRSRRSPPIPRPSTTTRRAATWSPSSPTARPSSASAISARSPSKPVMEGKAVLFKRFADVDSIDLEVGTEDPDEFINAVKYLGPSFGGINLEDIKAPECFIHRGAPARDDGHSRLSRRPARHRDHRRRGHDQRDASDRPRHQDDAPRLQRRGRRRHRLSRPHQGDRVSSRPTSCCATPRASSIAAARKA